MSTVKVERHTYTVEPLTQWDRNQTLVIYGLSLARAPEVHFSNMAMDRAITRQATMDSTGVITVSVPNGLLQKPYPLTAHLCQYTGATFETLYTLKIPVTERKQPADYTIEDDGDVYSFNELRHLVTQAVADMKAAEQSMSENLGGLVGEAIGDFLDASLTETGKAADAKAVSDALDAFLVTLAGKVLWENEDPTAEFGAQTIPLDLTPYKRIAVTIKSATKANIITTHCYDYGQYYSHIDSSTSGARYFTTSETGIEFTIANPSLVPIRIVGYDY